VDFSDILNDKSIKPKERTGMISDLLSNGKTTVDSLIRFAGQAKPPDKATCIEALEHATKANAAVASPLVFDFTVTSLADKAPRVKWESARVIGNIAHLFPEKVSESIPNLLENTEHPGTVVRWSAAFALGEILKMKTLVNQELVPAVEVIISREEKNSIRKIYSDALKKITVK
jgi:HEAT repeat protein